MYHVCCIGLLRLLAKELCLPIHPLTNPTHLQAVKSLLHAALCTAAKDIPSEMMRHLTLLTGAASPSHTAHTVHCLKLHAAAGTHCCCCKQYSKREATHLESLFACFHTLNREEEFNVWQRRERRLLAQSSCSAVHVESCFPQSQEDVGGCRPWLQPSCCSGQERCIHFELI